MSVHVQTKRAYDAAAPEDGYRVFVDRLWPRGLSKENFTFDLWCKDLAPSPALRTWFGHKVEHWDQFRQSYQNELRSEEQLARMRDLLASAAAPTISLIYAAKDTRHNHALILADELERVAMGMRKR
ncbi:MAG TPA: DUF488 family protein [Eoetvoesiella sp.]